jgi:hypothetical protein
VDTPSTQRDPWELASEAVNQMARNGDVMRSDRLKQVMQQIDPNFDERNAGFNRFSKFVMEAGQKGVVLVNKLDNGQFEVAPARAGGLTSPVVAPAAAQRGRNGAEAGREDGSRRGRGRRGRGRDRERPSDGPREEGAAPRPSRDLRAGGLTLARAFQLMTQALGELRTPVSHEALRLRMVAMYGREDPLLETARFSRLLRQANDAEVADVRKVGDDEYEISPHHTALPAPPPSPALPPPPPAREDAGEPAVPAAAPSEVASARDNGQRLGLRFRRGSRGPVRPGEIPLVGVVQIEAPQPEATPSEVPMESAAAPSRAKRPRARRAPRKKATAGVASGTEASASAEPEATPTAKRPRRRTRKKPE